MHRDNPLSTFALVVTLGIAAPAFAQTTDDNTGTAPVTGL
jgi:hypothetical protein